MNDLRHKLRQHGAPVSVSLIAAWGVAFLAAWLTQGRVTIELLFSSADAASRPWTFLTYPFALEPTANGLISVVFLGFWFWNIGARMEREMSSPRFALFCLVFTVLAAVLMLVGATLLRVNGTLYSGWFLASAVTVMWGTRYPNEQAMFMLLLPLQAKWLAVLSAALVFFGTQPPSLAPFVAAPLLLVYLFAAGRLGKAQVRAPSGTSYKMDSVRDKRYFDEVRRREKERDERERLRKLFESSLSDDDDKR